MLGFLDAELNTEPLISSVNRSLRARKVDDADAQRSRSA
jgi:hypothetical protein